MTRYRIAITLIWWTLGLAILLVAAYLFSLPGVVGRDWGEGLDWLLPNLVPTMTLTGAVAYAAPRGGTPEGGPETVPSSVRFAFYLACFISLVYLAMVAFVIVQAVGTTIEDKDGVIAALRGWNKLLGVFQGFAASAIGIFFTRN